MVSWYDDSTRFPQCIIVTFYAVLRWLGCQRLHDDDIRIQEIRSCLCLNLFVLFAMDVVRFPFDILFVILYKIPSTLYRSCHKLDPANIPATKCVAFNGYIYATAHLHDVDGSVVVNDGRDLVSLAAFFDAGFEIAPGDDNDVAVVNAHPWGCSDSLLAFADKHEYALTVTYSRKRKQDTKVLEGAPNNSSSEQSQRWPELMQV